MMVSPIYDKLDKAVFRRQRRLEHGAVTHVQVEAFTRSSTEDKDTIEGLLGFTQVLSPRTERKLCADLPEAFTSAIAISAAAAMWLVSDSMGPVKPIRIPSFTSSAVAAPAVRAQAETASSSFFIC